MTNLQPNGSNTNITKQLRLKLMGKFMHVNILAFSMQSAADHHDILT